MFSLPCCSLQQSGLIHSGLHGKNRLEGDVMIKGLFPITSQKDEKCNDLDPSGLLWFMAMVYAVDKINHSPNILPNTTLGYEIDDTCSSIPSSMKYAIQIVSKYRPNSVCTFTEQCCGNDSDARPQEKRFSAVIGPAASWISIPVARLLGLYSIPQISYASTSRILGDKTRYNSFLRTAPSDEFQAQAMAEFVHHFQWNYVFLIASDDDYGKMGAAAFKTAAKNLNVCIANDAFIAFGSPNSELQIEDTMSKLNATERAQVVVVFSYLDHGERLLKQAEKMKIIDRTWVTSDGWSPLNSEIAKLNVSKTLLNGIFSFSINSKQVKGFETFVREVTVHKAQNYTWFARYLQESLNCKSPEAAVSSNSDRKVCDPGAVLPADHEIGTDFVANVIDAVNVVAYAVHNILMCNVSKMTDRCPNRTNLPIAPETLLQFAAEVDFQGVDFTRVKFDKNGERTTSDYVIRNLQLVNEKSLRYIDVGRWSRNETATSFILNETLIVWNSGTKPKSTCFRECQPGERVVGQSDCCWNCQKCDKGQVSSEVGSAQCTACNDTHYANVKRTECILREVVYLKSSQPAGFSVIVVSCLGILAVTAVVVVLLRERKTPVVAMATPHLTIVFFVAVYMSFILNMIQVTSPPSNGLCAFTGILLALTFVMYSAFFLAKTRTATEFMKSAVSRFTTMHLSTLQVLGVGALICLQVVLIIIWQATSNTGAHFKNQEDNTRLLECYEDFSAAHIVVISYPIIVLLIATLLAFRERHRLENFNEAKAISFSTIALCIVLVAFIPTYRYVVGNNRVLVVAFCTSVQAFSCTGCLFIPKLYIIFFRPERNSIEVAGYSTHPAPSPDQISPDIQSGQNLGQVNFGASSSGSVSNGKRKSRPSPDNSNLSPVDEKLEDLDTKTNKATESDKEEISSISEVWTYAVI